MEQAVNTVNEELNKMKLDITTKDQMKQIATISSQSDEVGDLISQIFDKVGKDGVVQVEESNTMGMSIEMVEGMQFDNGYISPHMVTDYGRMESVFENAEILLTDKKIISFRDFLPLLESMMNAGKKHLVIISEDVEGDALATLVINRMKGAFVSVAVKAPGFGDRRKQMLQDIAVLTGGTVISSEIGMKLENATMEHLGHAKKVVVTKDTTTIIDGQGDSEKINERIDQLRNEYKTSDKEFEKEKLQERLAKLTGGVALLRVGAATEVELRDKKLRIEDALSATRSAIEEGIVIGGGCALLQASMKINPKDYENEAERVGAEIVKKALSYPFVQIAENAGDEEPRGLITMLKTKWEENKNYGLNADEDIQDHQKCIVDMFKLGIIDPKKVARCSMENAMSVAAMFLTTEGVIAELPEKKPEAGNKIY
jgi:chaperonin GroEL